MGHRAGAHHVQINVGDTAVQVRVCLNGGCVIAVFPERALSGFSAVVLLCTLSCHQLHAARSRVTASVQDQQVNVIGGDDVVEDAKAEALARFVEPVQVVLAIARELEQELTPVTAVRDVPDQAGEKLSIGARHRLNSLECGFGY